MFCTLSSLRPPLVRLVLCTREAGARRDALAGAAVHQLAKSVQKNVKPNRLRLEH